MEKSIPMKWGPKRKNKRLLKFSEFGKGWAKLEYEALLKLFKQPQKPN